MRYKVKNFYLEWNFLTPVAKSDGLFLKSVIIGYVLVIKNALSFVNVYAC